ncbi:hypothetical protein B0O99DRAFT_739152 [Bisporella sp. PMI_857]|nr:hypothetical protein B0O99DRAFT_739152 [Bisporella sp. PMI_857]
MRSGFVLDAFLVISGFYSLVSAKQPLGTVTPCPKCPSSIKPSPIVVTEQYQPVSTCSPVKECSKKKCSSTASCSTYDWVSTVIPCLGGTETTTITKTDQTVKLAHVSTVLTSYLPCATPTVAPYYNGTVPRYKNETCTSTKLQTMVVDISAPYNECGPLALPPWEGSGLCKTCVPNKDSKDQKVHVSKCLDGQCSTYVETWVSQKPKPTSSTSKTSYKAEASCSKSGVNTIPITATFTPTDSVYSAPVTKTFTLTTSVPSPQVVQVTTYITVTFTAQPKPTVSSSKSVGAVATTTYCSSNGAYTIPIVTTCTPHGSEYTEPVTTTVYYTTTVTDGPKEIGCTKTVTVTFTKTVTFCPETVISGITQSASPTAPVATPATTTPVYPTGKPTQSIVVPTSAPEGGSTGKPTGPSPTGPTTRPSPTPKPGVPDCEYYGCLGSTDGFSGFILDSNSHENDIELCTSECKAAGYVFAGLYNTECYCAGSIEEDKCSSDKANGVCNVPCPGDKSETCGGNQLHAKRMILKRTQNHKLFDVYSCKPSTTITRTSETSSETSTSTPEPSSDPDPAPEPRGIDADMENLHKARDIKLRRGGMLRNAKAQQGPSNLAKRNFGVRAPFGH